MTREVVVVVPLPHHPTMALLLQAAEALQHRVVTFDAEHGVAEIRVDFSLGALSTFTVHAEGSAHGESDTRLRLVVRPGFRLGFFTGVGQSERIAWQLIGKMQHIMNPKQYEALEDDVLPPRSRRAAGSPRRGG